tara:strand:- start:56 stop:364 length:309 start_codon:yes stop_codon:yes gene_type:complete
MPDKHVKTRDKKGRWKQGRSGNPNGRPKKNLCIPDILKEIGNEENIDGINNLEMVMRVVFKKALNGEIKAIEFIAERLEGKVAVKDSTQWVKPFDKIVLEGL